MADKLTKELMAVAYPELLAEIETATQSKGEAFGFEKGKKEGIAAGAETERNRITGLQELSLPGHERIIKEAIADGVSTKADAALKIVAAEKAILGQKLKLFKEDSEDVAAVASAAVPVLETKPVVLDENTPIEERAKQSWDKDAKLRAEFNNEYGAYLAYEKANDNGQVKIYKGK